MIYQYNYKFLYIECISSSIIPTKSYNKIDELRYYTEVGRRIYASVNNAIIDSDNRLSLTRRQAIVWANDVWLLIGPLRTVVVVVVNYMPPIN